MEDKWLCVECGHVSGTFLTAPNPFDLADQISGCENCKSVNSLVAACDEPGCNKEASCGFPTESGYRRTCGEHYRAAYAAPQQIDKGG